MITVKNVEIRSEEINLEVGFQDLTKEGQKRVFLENKKDFIDEALKSKYSTVRRLLWEPEVLETCSSDVLNEAILLCINLEIEDIVAFVKAVGSELNEQNRNLIAYLVGVDDAKVLIAKDKKTSLRTLKLRRMFTLAAEELVHGNAILFDAIVSNPNFSVDEDIEKEISRFSSDEVKIIKKRMEQLKK